MSDFHQGGTIATIHRLGSADPAPLEKMLEDLSAKRPLALVLPCHARDLHSEALEGILRELAGARFVRHVVVGLDGADRATRDAARSMLGHLPMPTTLLWNDGPAVTALLGELADAGFDFGPPGKGRNMRLCLGAFLHATDASCVAIHDCDIVNYRRPMLARLCLPVVDPAMGFEVAKGFSARFTDRLNGRVMRLLVTPLLRAMECLPDFAEKLGGLPSLRYPVSGEVCLGRAVAAASRFPSDWGVEVGMMADIFRVCRPSRICQVDFAETYDHKHQSLSEADPASGLNRMAFDVALCLLRHVDLPDRAASSALVARYARTARDMLRFYMADAKTNLLAYDEALEIHTIALFARSVRRAVAARRSTPSVPPGLPSWDDIAGGGGDPARLFRRPLD
jgi:glucosyl-3-phosphoglycerate synthase